MTPLVTGGARRATFSVIPSAALSAESRDLRYRFAYVLLNPFRVFVTVNDPSARAETLM